MARVLIDLILNPIQIKFYHFLSTLKMQSSLYQERAKVRPFFSFINSPSPSSPCFWCVPLVCCGFWPVWMVWKSSRWSQWIICRIWIKYYCLISHLQEHPRPKYETLLLQKRQRKRRNRKKNKSEVCSFLIQYWKLHWNNHCFICFSLQTVSFLMTRNLENTITHHKTHHKTHLFEN